MIKRLKQWLHTDAPAADAAPAQQPQLRVLMVCMGNICRSPTAEGVLRGKLQQAGLLHHVQLDSAGTHGYHTGEAPDPRAIRHAARRGYNIAGLRARPVHADDFARFDWLLAMDDANLQWLRKHLPDSGGSRIELLMPYALHHPNVRDVPDPYYGTAAGFEQVLDLLEDACDGVVRKLRADLKA